MDKGAAVQLDSLGRFAAYLSCCAPACGLVDLAAKEKTALATLANASISLTDAHVDYSAPAAQRDTALRVWRFLRNVRELKSVKKDEKWVVETPMDSWAGAFGLGK